jgi:hypothetical protein
MDEIDAFLANCQWFCLGAAFACFIIALSATPN